MKKVSFLVLLLAPVFILSCKKNYFEFKGWAPPPPGYVPVPVEVRTRFCNNLGVLYDYGTLLINDSSKNGGFYTANVSNTESYPTDTALYIKDYMNSHAQDIFYTIFFDQKNNKPFLKAYDLVVEKVFKVEQEKTLRKTLEIRYPLTDTLFN